MLQLNKGCDILSYVIINKDDEKSLKVRDFLVDKIHDEYNTSNPQKVIVVGGDGTFLKAVHTYEKIIDDVTFFIYNTGHLGYFSNYEDDTIDALIEAVNSDNYRVGTYTMLDYRISTTDGLIEGRALNEVTIINPTRTLMLEIYMDNVLLEHFRGTGICVSTPAGSTAYNKSLGGAVIDASLEAFQVTEIASINSKIFHTLSSPIVLSKKHEVEFKLEGNSTIWITVDSKSINIDNFNSIAISLSDKKVKYAKNHITFINRLTKNFI